MTFQIRNASFCCTRHTTHCAFVARTTRASLKTQSVENGSVCNSECSKLPTAVKKLTGLAAAGLMLFSGSSLAADKVGEFTASGILFKDSVEALAIDDPEVKGVTIYVSDFKRNLKDKLSNLGEEPSSASVTCAVTGPIEIRDPGKIKGSGGEDVFSEKRGLGFIQNKTLHVRRVFDEPHKTLLYIAYSTRLTNDKAESPGRYKTSICALPISAQVAPVKRTSDNGEIGLFAPVENNS